MPQRIAACCSLIVFAVCLVAGGVIADNPFTTTVRRALLAMGITLVIGLVIGAMAQRMLEESVAGPAENPGDSARKPGPSDR